MLIGCLSGYYFVSLKFQFVLPPSSMSSPYSSKSYTFLVFCLSFINRCSLIPSLLTLIPTTVSNTYSNLLLELLLSYTAYQITSTILAKSCNWIKFLPAFEKMKRKLEKETDYEIYTYIYYIYISTYFSELKHHLGFFWSMTFAL